MIVIEIRQVVLFDFNVRMTAEITSQIGLFDQEARVIDNSVSTPVDFVYRIATYLALERELFVQMLHGLLGLQVDHRQNYKQRDVFAYLS